MSEAGHWIAQAGNYSFNMDTLVTMWAAMAFLIIFALIATRKLTLVPTKLQVFSESLMGFFWTQVDSMIPHNGRKHIPIVASLFLFIVTANLMGQIPLRLLHLRHGELASPTNDINMTAALAVVVLMYYLIVGIMKKGFKVFYHGLSIPGFVEFLIDLLDMVTRPFSLALRLFCNIFVGEVLVGAMLGIFAYFLPLPIMFFEVFVALVQALVFMMLTIAYVSMAVNEEH
jgi:F-type H+-transporting ATPase subunit a